MSRKGANVHVTTSPAFQQSVEELRAKNLIGAFAQIVRGRNAQGLASIISQRETYLRVRERIVRDKIRKMVAFGGFGATVETTAGFGPAFEAAIASRKPAILHLKVDPEAITPTTTLSAIREKSLARVRG